MLEGALGQDGMAIFVRAPVLEEYLSYSAADLRLGGGCTYNSLIPERAILLCWDEQVWLASAAGGCQFALLYKLAVGARR
jgi:hypothetical protein